MGLFHRHRWRKIGEAVFTEPTGRKIKYHGHDAHEHLERAHFGFTSVRYDCQDCDKTVIKEYTGDQRAHFA